MRSFDCVSASLCEPATSLRMTGLFFNLLTISDQRDFYAGLLQDANI
jgi:hypothetical protein